MNNKRTAEFVLGLIGGILGIICGIAAMGIGGLGDAFGAEGANAVGSLGIVAIVLSILGIVGAIIVRSKAKLGGGFMTIAAVGGVICVSALYILPGILLIIGGLMGLFKKSKDKDNSISA
ncbi:DUF4064 domain-containing protein [Haloimpatiens sp. FM7330]|uniref:DUF4064 domain-containing protein n=1 Tax=Haloimpatiens sp. FM7330 TaxID=3298610 RepID=UPI00363CFDCA